MKLQYGFSFAFAKSPSRRCVPFVLAGTLALLLSASAKPALRQGAGHTSSRNVATHLATFDTLDFDVFTHQKWERLHESHSKGVVVHWPDGHQTKGIERHISDMKALFVYAPDTRIEDHPVAFGAAMAQSSQVKALANGRFGSKPMPIGSGEWTCVTGVMKGTFTKPMPLPNGKFIQPTGKAFVLPMSTVGRWQNGLIVEEWLFWDNQTYMKEIGAAP